MQRKIALESIHDANREKPDNRTYCLPPPSHVLNLTPSDFWFIPKLKEANVKQHMSLWTEGQCRENIGTPIKGGKLACNFEIYVICGSIKAEIPFKKLKNLYIS